ncbi:MAG TPA: hypoxanthine phosphoribosyltransferase [Bacillota bacterium]|nr:hypoxanthine phosphoribosyltransferase [Bacillota bacterium]
MSRDPDVRKVLISRRRMAARVAELGEQISADYAGRSIHLVGILKGAVTFMADLARELSVSATFDFMAISSYGGSTESSGVVRFLKDLDESVAGRHVLIVEDIVDSGLTLHYLRESLQARGPASLAVAVALDKAERRQVPVVVEYVGFAIPDEFVVGYGLDYSGRYRNLPYVGILRPEVYSH